MQAKLERAQERPQNDFDAVLNKLKVPEMAAPIEVPKEQVEPAPAPPKPPSLSEELDREFKELEKHSSAAKTVKMPDAVQKPNPCSANSRKRFPVIASAPRVKTPETVLKVVGTATGSNPYLARVKARISSFWTPVDAQSMQDQQLSVVVRFRLHRSGRVTDVIMGRPSGNEYFDLAARRAILSAEPLPSFTFGHQKIILRCTFHISIR